MCIKSIHGEPEVDYRDEAKEKKTKPRREKSQSLKNKNSALMAFTYLIFQTTPESGGCIELITPV